MPAFHISPIGQISTPYERLEECPRNIDAAGPPCKLVVFDKYKDGLKGLRVGQRILILYWFDQADRNILQQNSRRTGELAGIFALRTPNRSNPVGAAVLPIVTIERNTITVRGLDCLNGTALIDIKPAMSGE